MCTIRLRTSEKKQFTKISNRFIDEYMADANGSYVKIYLYLLRCISASVTDGPNGLDIALSAMADRLEYTEKDILRALRYWAKRGVLEFGQAEDGSVSWIELTDLANEEADESEVNSSVQAFVRPTGAATTRATTIRGTTAEATRAAKTTVPPTAKTAEPSQEASLERILDEVETLLCRPLSRKDSAATQYLIEALQFSPELIRFLYEYCVTAGKTSPDYIQKVAIRWKEEGICTVEAAKNAVQAYRAGVRAAMKEFGLSGNPGAALLKYVNRWESELHMPAELIELACSRAYLATGKASCQYADSILVRWSNGGAYTIAEVEQLDSEHARTQTQKSVPNSNRSVAGAFSSFAQQREYSEEDMAAIELRLRGL